MSKNSMLDRLAKKAESHVPRTITSVAADATSSSGSRVTPEQFLELTNKIAAIERTAAAQHALLETLKEHSESHSKGYIELRNLHKEAAPKIASLEATLSKEEERSSAAASALSKELTSMVDGKTEALRQMVLETNKKNELAFESVAKEFSHRHEQNQQMFDSLMTSLVGNNLSQNSTSAKLDELIKAYEEHKDIDPGQIELETAVKNIETAKEQSILAKEAGFPKTEQTLLQLGLQLAEQAGFEDGVLEIKELMGDHSAALGGDSD